jgi:hypothetical protein
LTGPARPSTPIARLRKVAMTCGAVPVPGLGGVLGVGGVADVVQRLDRPVPADGVGEAGGAGVGERQAGNGVDDHHPPAAGVGPKVAGLAGDLRAA